MNQESGAQEQAAADQGHLLLEHGDYSGAAALFEKVLLESPASVLALRGMGEACFGLGDRSGAKHYTYLALESDAQDPRTLNNAGVILFHEKDYERSSQFLKEAIKIKPDFGDAHINLCAALGRLTLADQKKAIFADQLLPSLRWISDHAEDPARDKLLKLNLELRQELLNRYRDRYRESRLRVLLYSPSSVMGALFYIFESWQQCLSFMGIETRLAIAGDPLLELMEEFAPGVLLSVDVPEVAGRIDWQSLLGYMNRNKLLIGLCSEFRETPRPADFYFTFHLDPSREKRLADVKSPLLSLPFAFNPLIHKMHSAQTLFDFAFVGTHSPLKRQETLDYLIPIVRNYVGVLAGVGWPGRFGNVHQADVALLYNFAAVCPNYHLKAQLSSYSEVNERTHVLQACGAFQICDNPMAIRDIYTEQELVVADSPEKYHQLFEHYLKNPLERTDFVFAGMKKAWEKYSQFHILDRLVDFLLQRS